MRELLSGCSLHRNLAEDNENLCRRLTKPALYSPNPLPLKLVDSFVNTIVSWHAQALIEIMSIMHKQCRTVHESAEKCMPESPYASTFKPPELPYTLSNTDVVLSEMPEEELFTFSVLSSSWTICTDWDAALISFVSDGEVLFFRSLCTVANADWAVVKLPEPSALPSAVRSVES